MHCMHLQPTAGVHFHGVHYIRVQQDRNSSEEGQAHQLDSCTLALARALRSEQARKHLLDAVSCVGGDQRFFHSKC